MRSLKDKKRSRNLQQFLTCFTSDLIIFAVQLPFFLTLINRVNQYNRVIERNKVNVIRKYTEIDIFRYMNIIISRY